MNKDEILYKFNALLDETIEEGDKENMEVSRAMFKKAVCLLVSLDAKKADEFVECFEGTLKYYNYLTESEAESIVNSFVNQDGSRGAKWNDPDEFFAKVEEFEGKTEYEPYYNKWALYVTANKFSSDQHSVIVKWTGNDRDKYIEACYDLAVTQLEDKDRLNWVRWYFGVSED